MGYFSSDTVVAFPATKRSTSPLSRLVSETSLTRIIRMLSPGGDGTFIVTSEDDWSTATILEFCLHGYYFSVTKAALVAVGITGNLWVSCSISTLTSGNYSGFSELQGSDVSSSYQGLVYSTTEPTAQTDTYSLQLFTSGALNTAVIISNLIDAGPAYVACSATADDTPSETVSTKKLWIDTTNNYIMRYYDTTTSTWIKLGAVYK